MHQVVDVVADLAAERWGAAGHDRADVVWRVERRDLAPFTRGEGPGEPVRPAGSPSRADPSVRLRGRLAEAGVTDGLQITARKPAVDAGAAAHRPRVPPPEAGASRGLDLVTVCEEAGCPNIFECWNDGTATFMINGERCTRACGFCLVDTSKPLPLDPDEPARVAEAVAALGLRYAVVTAVARDDLPDGGAEAFARTIEAVRRRVPGCRVEVLIPDCKGDEDALGRIFAARPDVLNHNIETVARLQRAVRPSASYARSLAVLGRARAEGLTTKSSIIVGMGETDEEVVQTLADLRAVGTGIVTIGQYLRPTTHHLPVARWVPPEQFTAWAEAGAATRHPPRRGEPADPLLLPRPSGGGGGHHDAPAVARARQSTPPAEPASATLAPMGKTLPALDATLTRFIERQHLFFVATAPDETDGHVNLSPKGYDTFRVLGPDRVAYLDLTGSGAETIAHLRQNGRITLLFCAFEGKPQLVRLYGRGEVLVAGDEGFAELVAGFPTSARAAQRDRRPPRAGGDVVRLLGAPLLLRGGAPDPRRVVRASQPRPARRLPGREQHVLHRRPARPRRQPPGLASRPCRAQPTTPVASTGCAGPWPRRASTSCWPRSAVTSPG